MEKSFQRLIDFTFFFNDIVHETVLLQIAVSGHKGAAAVVLIHFSIAEHIAAFQ
ncbi:hypothetical protein D3C78_1584080 [compost metagenome]